MKCCTSFGTRLGVQVRDLSACFGYFTKWDQTTSSNLEITSSLLYCMKFSRHVNFANFAKQKNSRKLSDSHYVHSQERKSLLPLERLKITFLLFWWIFGVNGCCVNWLTHKHELLVDIVRTAWFFLILTRGINRGYYLAAQRHEISLRVLENISRVSPPF